MYKIIVIIIKHIDKWGQKHLVTVLVEYFAGEKPLRMSQISRKFDSLRSNYCILARIVCNNLGFADFIVANWSIIAKFVCFMLAKHSSNTVKSNTETKKIMCYADINIQHTHKDYTKVKQLWWSIATYIKKKIWEWKWYSDESSSKGKS